jgi:DNA-binding transcriptional MerR regulator
MNMTVEAPEHMYGIEELAELAGVSRRTVRYYVQRGLLPTPTGLGRGRHYTEEHLATLVRIRELQERGVPLLEIAAQLAGHEEEEASVPLARASVSARSAEAQRLEPEQSTWSRIALSSEVEVFVRGRRLSAEQVQKLGRAVERVLRERSDEREEGGR